MNTSALRGCMYQITWSLYGIALGSSEQQYMLSTIEDPLQPYIFIFDYQSMYVLLYYYELISKLENYRQVLTVYEMVIDKENVTFTYLILQL